MKKSKQEARSLFVATLKGKKRARRVFIHSLARRLFFAPQPQLMLRPLL